MAFERVYAARLTEPLAKQLMAILQRDMLSALASVDATLPTFAEWNFTYYPPTQWPALLLSVQTDTFTNPNIERSRLQMNTISLVAALSGQDRNQLAQQAWRYVLAIDRIISSLGAQVNASKTPNFNDFYAALPLVVPFPQAASQSVINETTTPMQEGSVLACYAKQIRYSEMQRPTTNLEMNVYYDFVVEVEET